MKKRIICGSAAILLTGLTAAMFSVAASHTRGNALEPQAAAAASVAPQVIDTVVVERGRYLVKTAGCNDCHTPGYAVTSGGVAENLWLTGDSLGWQGPWGTTYPINLRLYMHSITA